MNYVEQCNRGERENIRFYDPPRPDGPDSITAIRLCAKLYKRHGFARDKVNDLSGLERERSLAAEVVVKCW